MQGQFRIELLSLSWLDNLNQEEDLCAHGCVALQIGGETLSNQEAGDWAVQATGLYLLRSLTRDIGGTPGSQILQCCGHFMIVPEDKGEVLIVGCPTGIDWTISHVGQFVVHTSEKGSRAEIPIQQYKEQVFSFADRIKKFYEDSLPKVEPEDDETAKAYKQFWVEWNSLRKAPN